MLWIPITILSLSHWFIYASNHYCSIKCRQTTSPSRMVWRPASPCPGLRVLTMLDEFWMQQSETHPSPKKNPPIIKIVSSGPPNEFTETEMVTLRKGYLFSTCFYSNAMPESVTLWFICRKASMCRHAACLESTSGAQLWKTAHCLAKGSKPMVTFCLSSFLYSLQKRQDTENFPSNWSLFFSKWPFNCGACCVWLGNYLLRVRGSIRNKWDKI